MKKSLLPLVASGGFTGSEVNAIKCQRLFVSEQFKRAAANK